MDKAIAGLYKEAAKFVAVRRTKHRHKARISATAEYHAHWHRIGCGHYGEAWVNSAWPEYVLKVSGRAGWGDDYWRYDAYYYEGNAPRLDAWPTFAKHCLDNPNKHLPKIMHYEETSRGVSWAIMPKYNKFTDYGTPDVVDHLTWAFGNPDEALENEGADYWVNKLVQVGEVNQFTYDMHWGNFMCDKDGTVVIVDPFSTVNDPQDSMLWQFNY